MMTREEAILLSAYTGFLLAPDFSEVHKFCEDTLGRPIWTHEFADSDVQKEIQEKLRPQIMELVQNIAALRPVSREQVEKVWRGEWEWYDEEVGSPLEGIEREWGWRCSKCKTVLPDEFDNPDDSPAMRFCQWCGAPMTDEAVEMVMERWKEAVSNEA